MTVHNVSSKYAKKAGFTILKSYKSELKENSFYKLNSTMPLD